MARRAKSSPRWRSAAKGCTSLLSAVGKARRGPIRVAYPEAIERALESVSPAMPGIAPLRARPGAHGVCRRRNARRSGSSPRVTAESLLRRHAARETVEARDPGSVPYAVGQARSRAAAAIAARVRRFPSGA